MKITDILLAEHIVFHNVFDHIERELPRLRTVGEVKALAHLLEDLLHGHSQSEDDLLFAPMEHCLAQMGQLEGFLHEHREIDASLKRVLEAGRVADARRLMLRALAYSRNHFEHEERFVFPLAEQVMKPETLGELGRAWMKQREGRSQ